MTLIIDTASLIGGGILLLLVLAATLTDVFLRKSRCTENPLVAHEADKVKEMAEPSCDYPPVSIIVTPHDKAYELDQHLPMLLEQDYPAPFRILVVVWRGESDTDDVLKKYAANPHLYATYIPDSSRYMSRKKLAITVGEKAATTEWLLLTDVTCRPQSKYWLRAMPRRSAISSLAIRALTTTRHPSVASCDPTRVSTSSRSWPAVRPIVAKVMR